MRLAFVLGLVLMAGPAVADEFTDVVEEALEAYRGGDVAGARKDLDYAVKLLADAKAQELAALLPAAPEGWTREDGDAAASGMGLAMFGGGTAVSATYSRGDDSVELSVITDSPMVSAVSSMVGSMASLAGTATRRIHRTPFAVTDGEMQGVIDDRVLVSATGSASEDDKAALIELMDFDKLSRF
ncbi:hypothetical protein [Amaricoccus sp.]|uniref:hypothetical protein n=1 Tax=Amaricoccus sp. TaxID=1872485 RepID=UPI001B606FCE|nr:hypothetical protein [Amaricoccus sp.]MBP7242554.1 hypothetical protein [Amaricoccus sp.]